MTALDQLEELLAEERRAMVGGDWATLEALALQKERLADEVAREAGARVVEQVRRVASAARHNLALASSLSRQIHELLTCGQQPPSYGPSGRRQRAAQAVVSCRG